MQHLEADFPGLSRASGLPVVLVKAFIFMSIRFVHLVKHVIYSGAFDCEELDTGRPSDGTDNRRRVQVAKLRGHKH
jgi:hypothetical protein